MSPTPAAGPAPNRGGNVEPLSPRPARRKGSAPSSRDPSPPPRNSWADGQAQAAADRALEQQASRYPIHLWARKKCYVGILGNSINWKGEDTVTTFCFIPVNFPGPTSISVRLSHSKIVYTPVVLTFASLLGGCDKNQTLSPAGSLHVTKKI